MSPFVFQINCGPPEEVATCACKPNLSYLHTFNHAGGRSTERVGSRGSFTPGIRIVSGGPSRHVPVATTVYPGTILHIYPELNADMPREPRTNVVGGRPTERLGARGGFTPGVRCWQGGEPGDVPLEAKINPGTVLSTYSGLKPDKSGEARTNAVRPTERLGSRGSFTPGVRCFLGGKPRDVPLEAETNPGTVLFTYPDLRPDTSDEAHTNVVGGRPTERLGSRGSFTPGLKRMLGGVPRDVPLEQKINPGTILFTYPHMKPDLSGEARINAVRPTERLGTRGSFTPGVKRVWLGGTPRDVPPEADMNHGTILCTSPNLKPYCKACTNGVGRQPHVRPGISGLFTPCTVHWLGGEPKYAPSQHENADHGTVLFPPPVNDIAATVQHGSNGEDGNCGFFQSDIWGEEDEGEVVGGAPLPLQPTDAEDSAMFNTVVAKQSVGGVGAAVCGAVRRSGSESMFARAGANGGVFRRCGSDSKFPAAGADLLSGSFPTF